MALGEVQNQPLSVGMLQVQASHGVVVFGIGGTRLVFVARRAVGAAATLAKVAAEALLRRAVLPAVEQVEALLKKPLVALKRLALLGLGNLRHGRGQRRGESRRERQPGK